MRIHSSPAAMKTHTCLVVHAQVSISRQSGMEVQRAGVVAQEVTVELKAKAETRGEQMEKAMRVAVEGLPVAK